MIKKYFIYLLPFLFTSNFLNACAVCYGAPEDPITQSLNKAMLFMLFIVVFVLSCIIYSIITLVKRSNNVQT